MSADTCWIDVEIKAKSKGGAFLCKTGTGEGWIPGSQIIDYEDEPERGVTTKIEIAQWLAEDKGLV